MMSMKRITIAVISAIVAVTLICTGIVVHNKRSVEPFTDGAYMAPPNVEGLSEAETNIFFQNNSTMMDGEDEDEYGNPDFGGITNGTGVVEEYQTRCPYIDLTGFATTNYCYWSVYNRGCRSSRCRIRVTVHYYVWGYPRYRCTCL